jgi:hypothetical protein
LVLTTTTYVDTVCSRTKRYVFPLFNIAAATTTTVPGSTGTTASR